MAIVAGITVDYTVNPRIVQVASPITELTCQDLYDTLKSLQAQPSAMDETNIVRASGLEELGGGVRVGLTVTLLDALVQFEARATPTVCKVSGGNLVSLNTTTQTFLDLPLAYSNNVMATYTSSSSATQANIDSLNYSSYQNAVWLDVNTSNTGIEFPSGTRAAPVNNIYDAVAICADQGFDTIQLLSPLVFPNDVVLDNLKIRGVSNTQTLIFLSPLTSTFQTQIFDCYVSGTVNSEIVLDYCVTGPIDYLNGAMNNCWLTDNIVLGGDATAYLTRCVSARVGSPVVFDFDGQDQNLVLREFSGDLVMANLNDAAQTNSLYFTNGVVTLDSSLTAGTFIIRGPVTVNDNSTGTTVVNLDGVTSPANMAEYTWSYERA